jgi:hypothetical protein
MRALQPRALSATHACSEVHVYPLRAVRPPRQLKAHPACNAGAHVTYLVTAEDVRGTSTRATLLANY